MTIKMSEKLTELKLGIVREGAKVKKGGK